jgi:hypothetical protein
MKLTGAQLMAGGALFRLTYGLGAMFAPRFIAGRYAAAEPGSVMNLRGFGGQHMAVGLFSWSPPARKSWPDPRCSSTRASRSATWLPGA